MQILSLTTSYGFTCQHWLNTNIYNNYQVSLLQYLLYCIKFIIKINMAAKMPKLSSAIIHDTQVCCLLSNFEVVNNFKFYFAFQCI